MGHSNSRREDLLPKIDICWWPTQTSKTVIHDFANNDNAIFYRVIMVSCAYSQKSYPWVRNWRPEKLSVKSEGSGTIAELGTANPTLDFKLKEYIRRVFSVGLLTSSGRKRKRLFLNTAKVNEEVPPILLHNETNETPVQPTPVGKRDVDIPATSLRQKSYSLYPDIIEYWTNKERTTRMRTLRLFARSTTLPIALARRSLRLESKHSQ